MVEPEGCSNEDLNIFIVFPGIFNNKCWEKECYKINFQELDKWGKGLEYEERRTGACCNIGIIFKKLRFLHLSSFNIEN